jgi:hypothetical protein
MKNTDVNAIVRVGDLSPASFYQDDDGKIKINSDVASVDADRTIVQFDVDLANHVSKIALVDASSSTRLWGSNLNDMYSPQGKYVGSWLNLALPNLS